MVEEKKQLRFKLRVTKKRMVEVVDKYFPGQMKRDSLKDVLFSTVKGNECGWLIFSDSFGIEWKAFISEIDEKIELVFERTNVGEFYFSRDRGKFYPDIEYLDLLGMIVKY